jgi:hypothetical protein
VNTLGVGMQQARHLTPPADLIQPQNYLLFILVLRTHAKGSEHRRHSNHRCASQKRLPRCAGCTSRRGSGTGAGVAT